MNTVYKKLIILSRALGAPGPADIFERGGMDVSNSQLQAWRVGVNHKHHRPIPEGMLSAYIDGLIAWVDESQ